MRFTGVGDKAHGTVLWRGSLVLLDSEAGALAALDPAEAEVVTIWKVSGIGWRCDGCKQAGSAW